MINSLCLSNQRQGEIQFEHTSKFSSNLYSSALTRSKQNVFFFSSLPFKCIRQYTTLSIQDTSTSWNMFSFIKKLYMYIYLYTHVYMCVYICTYIHLCKTSLCKMSIYVNVCMNHLKGFWKREKCLLFITRITKPIHVLSGQSNSCVSREYKTNTNQKSWMDEKSF